ncbi:MAG TPA: SDR family NAD(P)-dependent oxidoreductase [Chitinophagaceae bacterium]|nr:SDR family NAD(P)-dependent oxidoreductase [Chitinophagaceae bacterium]
MPPKIIVVGASSGIGKRVAEIYLENGTKVGITGRRLALLEEILNKYPQLAEIESFDVTGTENVSHLNTLVNKLGGLDILIISAGLGDPATELVWEIDKRTVDTNVNGFVEIANWGFNHFVKQGHGQLVVFSSIAANRGNSYAPAYSASKAFQSNYFEGLAIKASRMKKNITVTCIEPGFVNTRQAKGNKRFWVVPVDKAARQIIRAIRKKKRKVYISHRWWLIAKLMRAIPYFLYKKIG